MIRTFVLLLSLILVVSSYHGGFSTRLRDRKTSRRGTTDDELLLEPSEDSLEGAIEPMKIAIDSGFKEGKSIAWGVLQRDLDEADVPNKKEREKRKKEAAKELVNIDSNERNRRKIAGSVGAVFSTVLYGVLVTTKVSTITLGLSMYFPVALSLGFIESGRKGLWNVAQGGLWDIEGAGLQKIQDRNIAQAILARTNNMNKDIGIKAVGLTSVLAIIPTIIDMITAK